MSESHSVTTVQCKVNIAILRQFLCFRCQTKLIIRLYDEVIFITLFSFLHIQLPLLMLSKVNIAILRPFLFFQCLTKLIIHLNDDVIFITLLFSFLHILNQIQLPLFMLSKVNISMQRSFQCFRCLTKVIILLNHEAIFLSRILHCLNHIYLPLFMLSKVNISILRPFLFFRCLTKLIIRLNDEAIFISLLFRILHSLNHL